MGWKGPMRFSKFSSWLLNVISTSVVQNFMQTHRTGAMATSLGNLPSALSHSLSEKLFPNIQSEFSLIKLKPSPYILSSNNREEISPYHSTSQAEGEVVRALRWFLLLRSSATPPKSCPFTLFDTILCTQSLLLIKEVVQNEAKDQ